MDALTQIESAAEALEKERENWRLFAQDAFVTTGRLEKQIREAREVLHDLMAQTDWQDMSATTGERVNRAIDILEGKR